MQHSYNLLDSLLSDNELRKYNNSSFTNKAAIIHHALVHRLKEDPDYEVFAPLLYCLNYHNIKDQITSFILDLRDWHISNRGRVLSFRRYPEGRLIKPYTTDRENTQMVYVKDRRHSLLATRAVASVFVPSTTFHPKHMEVRQYDRSIRHTDFRNLYWEANS